MKENQTRSDVRPVGIANGDQPLLAEFVSLRSGIDEVCQLFGARLEIVDVKNALRETSKETGHTIFQDLASHAKERRAGPQFIAQGQKVVLITPGAVQ